MNVKILDCTIRDGGHLNKWHFKNDMVKASYFAALRSGVDYFEIGYKNDSKVKNLGPYGYCQDNFITSLFKSSPAIKLLCMIDAGKYTGYYIPECRKDKTPFSGIRIAAYPPEGKIAIKLIEEIHNKGYEVFLQIMACSEWNQKQFRELEGWKSKDMLKAVYFADSFGSFIPKDIKNYVKKLKAAGFKNIGYHSHNNLQMGFANALQAIDEGVRHIDASIYGMGRGAGNLPIEIILSYLYIHGDKKYNIVPYLDVIDRFYLDLVKEYQWGYSIKNFLSGSKNLHPYYVAELFKSKNYTLEEICNLLDNIKKVCPISFSKEKLEDTLKKRFYIPTTEQAKNFVKEIEKQNRILPSEDYLPLSELKISNKHKGKKFLIIANGPSTIRYVGEIKKFINENNLITIGCNYLKNIYEPNYHIFVSKKRFLKYISFVNEKSILIAPTFFGKRLIEENYQGLIERIEIKPVNNSEAKPISGIIQQPININVGVAAILTAYQMGAEEIMVVGMDGYESGSEKEVVYFYNEDDVIDDKATASIRYENLTAELKRTNDFLSKKGVPFSIITPTSHKRYYRNIIK